MGCLEANPVRGWRNHQNTKTKESTTNEKRKIMNNKFDELTKSLAQSVTRRAALKRFGIGLAGMALACFGLANRAKADPQPPSPCLARGNFCKNDGDCCSGICKGGTGGPFNYHIKTCS